MFQVMADLEKRSCKVSEIFNWYHPVTKYTANLVLGIALDVFPRDLSIFLLNSKISGMKLSCFDQNKD